MKLLFLPPRERRRRARLRRHSLDYLRYDGPERRSRERTRAAAMLGRLLAARRRRR